MAEVGAVYHLTPAPRAPSDIIGRDDDTVRPAAPKASNKWLTASVVEGAATVITSIFEEAQRRDPTHQRTWVALVDGAKHQIDRIQAEARDRQVQVTIVCDFIHVLEYLWSAAWSFHAEGDPAAQKWVADESLAVLNGQASTVAAAIRRKATTLGRGQRKGVLSTRWVIDVEGVGVTQSRTLAEAHTWAQGLVEAVTGEAGADVTVSPLLPDGTLDRVHHAQAVMANADVELRAAADEIREATRSMLQMGMSQQDVAAILGVSRQRVSQLLNA